MKVQTIEEQPQPAVNRRTFLKGVTGGVAALPVLPALTRAGSADQLLRVSANLNPGERVSESYWRLVKEQFTIRPNLIMLNAANLCPSPHMVREKVFRLTDDLDGDVSFQNRAKFDVLREEARRKLASLMGAADDEIAIVRNTSEANNLIVTGLQLKTGDEVVIFDQNHPTNNIAWDVRAARAGFTVKRVSFRNTPESLDEMLKPFQMAISVKTRVLAFTDVSNTTGVRCDSYSGSAHKWFLGPKEAGLLYIRRERVAEIWPSMVGVGWGDTVETSAKGARKFETLGQRDDAAVSSMGTTVDFHMMIGPARIEARILELAAALKEGCRKIPGARLRTSTNPGLSAGVCVIGFEGLDNQKIYHALYARYGIAGAPTGGVRFCPHIYNTMEEIDRTISALDQVVKAPAFSK
jgi:selenocysteine lyase/cysteine desulfurase